VKVFTTHDDEVLLHTEVQVYPEAGFDRRLFSYNARIDSKYDAPVVTLVILGDDSETWRPHGYDFTRWGFSLSVIFAVVKLLDYASREVDLESHPNPFALLVLAHLLARRTRQDAPAHAEGKIRLLASVQDREMEEIDRMRWGRFLDWLLPWVWQNFREGATWARS
jgi:hypothetical protein